MHFRKDLVAFVPGVQEQLSSRHGINVTCPLIWVQSWGPGLKSNYKRNTFKKLPRDTKTLNAAVALQVIKFAKQEKQILPLWGRTQDLSPWMMGAGQVEIPWMSISQRGSGWGPLENERTGSEEGRGKTQLSLRTVYVIYIETQQNELKIDWD